MKDLSNEQIIESTRCWVSSVVVDLNLCPFARRTLVKELIQFKVTNAGTEEALLMALQDELTFLFGNSDVETTLLIHPGVLQDFMDYNQFLDLADQLLVSMSLEGIFQIASFHPDYQFGGTQQEDPENYSNRSPYPMLHILREASVSAALESYPDPENIPEDNISRLNQLGTTHMQSLLASCQK